MEPTTALLRITPLLFSTSASVQTIWEDIMWRPWARQPAVAVRPQTNRQLAAWFRAFMPYGLTMTMFTYFGGIIAAIANLRYQSGGTFLLSGDAPNFSSQASMYAARFYIAGAVFNALHMAWGPWDMVLVDVIKDEANAEKDKGKDNTAAIGAFVRLNIWRGITCEWPGFVCNLVGYILSLA